MLFWSLTGFKKGKSGVFVIGVPARVYAFCEPVNLQNDIFWLFVVAPSKQFS